MKKIVAAALTACLSLGLVKAQVKQIAPGVPDNIMVIFHDGFQEDYLAAATLHHKDTFPLERFNSVAFLKTWVEGYPYADEMSWHTAIATGAASLRGHIGLDKGGKPVENLIELAQSRHMLTAISTTRNILKSPALAYAIHGRTEDPADSTLRRLIRAKMDLVASGAKESLVSPVRKELELAGMALEGGMDRLKKLKGAKSLVISESDEVSNTFEFLPLAAEHGQRLMNAGYYGAFYVIDFKRRQPAGKRSRNDGLLEETEALNEALEKVMKASGNKWLIILVGGRGGEAPVVSGATPEKGKVEYAWQAKGEGTLSYAPVFAFGPGSELLHGILSPTDLYGILAGFIKARTSK